MTRATVVDADPRVRELAWVGRGSVFRRTDRMFAVLLALQWCAAIVLAAWVSPLTWAGAESRIHPHVYIAVLLGLAVVSLPIGLALLRPGHTSTRHVIAVAQMLMSGLLIHLTAGRIETHFHVFGSLALLSIYRDWRVLLTASAVTAVDHVARGFVWPESMYGVLIGSEWRWIEHTGWVVFIDVFLVYACWHGQKDILRTAEREAALETSYATVESQVAERTRELAGEVAERARTEVCLRQSEEKARRLALVAAYTHNAVVITDAAGRIEWVNDGFIRLTGYSPEQVVGRTRGSILQGPETDPTIVAHMRDQFEAGAGFEVEVLNYDASGQKFWVEIGCRPVHDERGVRTNFITVESNVTARRAAGRALEVAVQAAEQANRTKSEFLANMSHEIRTPMNGILGMSELLLGTDLTHEQKDWLSLVKSSADALLTVINDILDFSKIEAGKLDLDPTPFFLSEAVGDTLKALAQRAHAKGLELACDIRPDVPDMVVGDNGRLRQVLTNLVGNAIKFTDRGEVVVRVDRVPETGDGYRIQFTVSDTGIGIPTSKLTSIFDPFTQADGSTTRRYGGTGLGLTISARLVAMMGGRIWAESETGQGSSFHFEAVFEQSRGSIERRRVVTADLRGVALLIVDDNATNRRVLAETVGLWGALPTCVGSGAEALTELRRGAASGDPYRLVLLDAMMPDMDGFAVAEQIGREMPIAGAAIVMLTSADQSGDAARCRDLGFAAYMVKPVKTSELSRVIADAIPSAPLPVRLIVAAVAMSDEGKAMIRPMRVLLAEDNAVNQRVATLLLTKGGHTVEVVGDGQAALEALERGDFDLVLMDVQMPVMDGFEATIQIREREAGSGRRTRIVAMTAHAMKGDRERCLAAGMDDYVSKPIQQAELSRVLAAAAEAMPDVPVTLTPFGEELPPYDRAAALERLGGDEGIFAEIASLFLEDAPRLLAQLRTAVAAGDAAEVHRTAHGLKGATGYVGGGPAAAAAQQLEEIGAVGDLTAAPTALRVLEAEIGRLSAALAAPVCQPSCLAS